jgi:hypothetical protein
MTPDRVRRSMPATRAINPAMSGRLPICRASLRHLDIVQAL